MNVNSNSKYSHRLDKQISDCEKAPITRNGFLVGGASEEDERGKADEAPITRTEFLVGGAFDADGEISSSSNRGLEEQKGYDGAAKQMPTEAWKAMWDQFAKDKPKRPAELVLSREYDEAPCRKGARLTEARPVYGHSAEDSQTGSRGSKESFSDTPTNMLDGDLIPKVPGKLSEGQLLSCGL